MPRGGKYTAKGRARKFTNPEELEEQKRRDEQKSRWRKQQGVSDNEDSDSSNSDSGSGSESDSSEEDTGKAKGVSNLIEIENPNRIQKKAKKLNNLNADLAKPELSRREREEIEKQRAQLTYQKLHAEGKTDQARADLARLAIIKQQREDAQRRRDVEKKEREETMKQRTEQTNKALGRKS